MKKVLYIIILIFSIFIYESNSYGDILSKTKNYFNNFIKGSAYTNIESKLIKNGVKDYIYGRVVIKNKNIFKLNYKDALGRSNCDRMLQGLAPIGIDDLPINLHHMKQKNDGELVEILDSEHKYYNKELHSYNSTSEIDRNKFNEWKKGYWKERGLKICK